MTLAVFKKAVDRPNDADTQNLLFFTKICYFLSVGAASTKKFIRLNENRDFLRSSSAEFPAKSLIPEQIIHQRLSRKNIFFVYIDSWSWKWFLKASNYLVFPPKDKKMEVVNDTNHDGSGPGATSATFSNVLVSNLEETGQSQPKYTFPVTLVAEYDPEVRHFEIDILRRTKFYVQPS